MKILSSFLLGLVLLSCVNTDGPSPISETSTRSATASATCCDKVDALLVKGTLTLTTTNWTLLTCCVSLLHASCVLNYPTAGTGGASSGGSAGSAGTTAVSTGGKPTPSTTDWHAVCVKTELAKAVNRNMAAKSGMTINAIATSVCSQASVVNCYTNRICK
jgi:hypothetical protein